MSHRGQKWTDEQTERLKMLYALVPRLSASEIAAELNMADQTVRNRKSEGLAMLRITLKNQYGLSPGAIITGLLYFL